MEQRSVESADGTRIAWTVVGTGKDVVVYPGSLSDGTNWLPVAEHLAATCTVHVISRRGTGASGDAAAHSIRREADDVVAVLEATGADSLVGHSYGAVCALEAARTRTALQRLVAYEPPIALDAPLVPPDALVAIEEAAARGDIDVVVDTGLRSVVRLPPAAVDALRASPAWESMVANGAHWHREIRALAERAPGVDRYADITAATLLLHGEQTPADHHHRKAVDALARVIPNAQVRALANVGHQGHLQDPAGLAAAVRDFLR